MAAIAGGWSEGQDIMAILLGASTAIRMDQLDLGDLIDGDTIERNSFTLQLDNGSGFTDTFRGIHFVYGGTDIPETDRLIGGILFAFNRSAEGETILDISRLNFRIHKFVEFARANNDSAALALAFADSDTMLGTSFDDLLNGYAGADDLLGGGGADTLRGGAGNDHLYGLAADDGSDDRSDGNDSLSGEDGNDYLRGDAGNDTLDGGAGADRVDGGRGNDVIRGSAGSDSLNGNLGNDAIDGGDGADILRGGQGNDTLAGAFGTDTISGDLGSDVLRGGSGADVFLFAAGTTLTGNGGADAISDFENGSDRFDLGFDVTAVLQGARQLSFSASLTAAQALLDERPGTGEVAALTVGRDTYLFFSATGGNQVDSAIQLSGFTQAVSIDTSDFL